MTVKTIQSTPSLVVGTNAKIVTTVSGADVDLLGDVLAKIAELTKIADGIKDRIKEGGASVEGDLFKATYVEQAPRATVDFKSLIKDLGISEGIVEKYTKYQQVKAVRVTAR